MNPKLIFAILLCLTLLIIITNNTKELVYSGFVQRIAIKEEITFLELKNSSLQFIVFTDDILDINKNDKIKLTGQKQIYNNQEQILVNKIYSLKN